MKTLAQRAESMRSRLRVRAWEFRQQRGSKGTWYRLRRMLARARDAYAVSDETMTTLHAEGFAPEPVGAELEPARRYVFVPPERIEAISERRPLRVRLSAELLGAPNVVLVAFT